MYKFRQSKDYGISWGVPGLRIGRSEYGRWWISIGLPFGFRITKDLSRMGIPDLISKKLGPNTPVSSAKPIDSPSSITPSYMSNNQKILEQMRGKE